EDDAHLREPGHRSLSGDLLGEQSADGVTGGDAGSGEQLGGDEFGLFADVSGHRCLVFMWFRGGRSPACAARWAETGDPWPVVVGVRVLRLCGRAPAQSILHASWIQDVAECRIARSRPRSDMEASTISYLGGAWVERGAEAKLGGAAINSRAGWNEPQAEAKRRGTATDPPGAWRCICAPT